MFRFVLGLLLLVVGIAGVLDAWLNPSAFQGSPTGAIVGFCVVFVVPGSALAHFGWRSRRKRRAATPAAEGQATFGMVFVIGKYEPAVPVKVSIYEQAEARLLKKVSSVPRYPLSSDAKITAIRADALPAEKREALEPYVWALQARHGRRGGRWQADFYHDLGLHFLVLYLE